MRQRDVAPDLLREQLVDKLVHALQRPAGDGAPRQLAVVRVQRLQVAVDIHGAAGKAQVESAEGAQVFVVLLLDEFDDDLL